MNRNQHPEAHYINTGFPYTVTDSFMDLFEGLSYVQTDFALAEALQDQESAYWSLQTYSEKQGITGPTSSNSHQHGVRARDSTRGSDNHSHLNNDEEIARVLQETEDHEDVTDRMAATHLEECNPICQYSFSCNRGHNAESSSNQAARQDNFDPDNMTYEELVELGETVGTHNRGLCPDLIAYLPVSKYKYICFRRKNNDRCVICHMDYKWGQKLITLPCKHPYHAECIKRWLTINKACPVCYVEVFGSER